MLRHTKAFISVLILSLSFGSGMILWGKTSPLPPKAVVNGELELEVATGNSTVYTLVRAPQSSPKKLAAVWDPFVEYLNFKTGYQFKLQLYKDRASFERDYDNGVGDVIFANAAYFLSGHKRHGYEALVRSGSRKLRGIIVVHRDSPLKKPEDLRSQTVFFPSPNALGASIYPRARLKSDFAVTVIPHYVGTHDNVYRAVALGKAIAGGGITRTLEREPEPLRKLLRVLYETPPMTAHPLHAHPRVPAAVKQAITQAVLGLNQSESGRKMLAALQMESPIAVNFGLDYKPLLALGFDRYLKPKIAKPGAP